MSLFSFSWGFNNSKDALKLGTELYSSNGQEKYVDYSDDFEDFDDFEYVEDFDDVCDYNVLKILMILMVFTILTILKMLMMALTLMKGYANRSNWNLKDLSKCCPIDPFTSYPLLITNNQVDEVETIKALESS